MMKPLKPTSRRSFLKRSASTSMAAMVGSALLSQESQSSSVKSSPQAKIKICQIGSRHAHADGKLATLRKLSDLYEVVGIVESDPKALERISQHEVYKGLPVLTEDQLFNTCGIQAVAVETDIESLVPTAKRCLEAGLHIHLDKPAGSNLAACKEMHQLASQSGLTVQMGYMFRYNPAFQLLFQAVRENWLGPITEVNGMIGKKASSDLRKELAGYSGGGMFELACHLIDALVTVMGKPDNVHPFNIRSRQDADSFADNQTAVFTYPETTAVIRCNHIDPFGGPRRSFSVTGENGNFEIRPLEPPVVELYLDQDRGPYKRGKQQVELPRMTGRYDGEFIDLAKIIRGEKKLEWDAAHDIAVQECVLKAGGML